MLHFGSRYAWPVVNRCIDILPEPWTLARGSASKHIGPWSTDLEPGTASRVQSLSARALRAPNRCYWGWLLDLDQIGSRRRLMSGVLATRTSDGNGEVEARVSNCVYVWQWFNILPSQLLRTYKHRHPNGWWFFVFSRVLLLATSTGSARGVKLL